jgi:hypothetical protein
MTFYQVAHVTCALAYALASALSHVEFGVQLCTSVGNPRVTASVVFTIFGTPSEFVGHQHTPLTCYLRW